MTIDYRDLREWLAMADAMGALNRAGGAGLDEDVGRIAETGASTEEAPALLLEAFEGYDPGCRILLNIFGMTGLIARTFGFPADAGRSQLLEHFKGHLAGETLIPPRLVTDGPVLENRLMGDDVDLTRFPVPLWHKDDGGPYIGTGSFVISRDPDEGWVNLGTYRNQLHDRNRMGLFISPVHHGKMHMDKYFARGEPFPVAVVLGSDPLLFTAGTTDIPWGVSEYDWVGGWRGVPEDVIEGPVTGLPIPARAEIAVEGFCYPGREHLEGPFGEWPGYYASERAEAPCIDVKGLYYRNDPILLGVPPQKPPYDPDKLRQYLRSALLVRQLQNLGIPGIANAWCYSLGGCRLLVAVSIKQGYPGHARQAGHAAYTTPIVNFVGKYVIVVDDDIDVTDMNDVMWALLTRSDPATSIDIITRATSSETDPRIPPEDREAGRYYNSRAIIDATRPFEWKDRFPRTVTPDAAYREKSRELFGHLFEVKQ